jgi:hypothetical protein
MTKRRSKKNQIDKIRDERRGITTNINKIQRLIIEYFGNLLSSELKNLNEIDKFLDAYNQTRLNQEDINHLYRPIKNNEIEAIIQSLPKKKSPGPEEFTVNFTKPLKKN